jgi:hypothetical protein
MKKIISIFNSFSEAKTKPNEKVKKHYLANRLDRLQRLAELARKDKNTCNTIRAHRLINELQGVLVNQSRINLPYIEHK